MKLKLQILREAVDFFYQIYRNRYILFTLSYRDIQKKYIKNFFGTVWAVADPFAFVTILYFVFGARYGKTNDAGIPFMAYLLVGYISYDFFSVTTHALTRSISDHSFLLSKVNFRVALLPLVRILSNLAIHFIIIGFTLVILITKHIYPSFYWLQMLYYLAAICSLQIALGWLTSSIFLFFADIDNILGILTRIMFFLTPIFWNIEKVGKEAGFVLKFNPVYYIVNGYRDSLLYHKGFWDHPFLTLYFWGVVFVILVIGVLVFKKLRPHFADVAD